MVMMLADRTGILSVPREVGSLAREHEKIVEVVAVVVLRATLVVVEVVVVAV
jgi:hypothetical protein